MSAVKKAVITAAGRGTRHFPGTRIVQKELFPLVDRDGFTKPVVQLVVEEALGAGIEHICLVCSPSSEGPLRAHFAPVEAAIRRSLASKPKLLAQAERLDRLSALLEFTVQPAPEGFGDAVLCARDFVGTEPFLLLLGDHVYLPEEGSDRRCARDLVDAYAQVAGPISSVARSSIDRLRLFGTVAGQPISGSPPLYRVTDMMEKPSPEAARTRLRTPGLPEDEFLTFFGMHVLPSRIFDHLAEGKARDRREGGEIQLTSSLEALVQEGSYYAVEILGQRLDMGVPEGLIETQTALALRSPYAGAVLDDQ